MQYRYGGQDCLARYFTYENETELVAAGAHRPLQPGREASRHPCTSPHALPHMHWPARPMPCCSQAATPFPVHAPLTQLLVLILLMPADC